MRKEKKEKKELINGKFQKLVRESVGVTFKRYILPWFGSYFASFGHGAFHGQHRMKAIKKKLVQILCIAEWNWLTHSTNCLNKYTFCFACIIKTSQKTLRKKRKSEVFKFVLSSVQLIWFVPKIERLEYSPRSPSKMSRLLLVSVCK